MSQMITLQQVLDWIPGATLVLDGSPTVTRVHTDSRTVQPGDLFVALSGDHYNANDFLSDAKARGALAIITESREKLEMANIPGLVVADTRKALGLLARCWRAQFELPLIAVTGSNGKTTVTQMIASILRVYRPQATLATEGNLNNDVGVPLTLLRLTGNHQVAVIELGMNHPGEIAWLAAISQPTVALVNNAQREHLEFMSTVEAVAHENGSVIAALANAGVAVFPWDDEFAPIWHKIAENRPQLTFAIAPHQVEGEHLTTERKHADIVCDLPNWAMGAWQVQASTPAGNLSFALHCPGIHSVKNALAAVTCAVAVGVPLPQIAQGLESFQPVTGRSRAIRFIRQGSKFDLVDDTYNANPDSVRAAIELLAGLPSPRLLVLGDMGEVGLKGLQFHAEAGAFARAAGIESIFTLGELSRATSEAFGNGIHWESMEELKQAVLNTLPKYQSILVKGSRFMKMERVVEAVVAAAQVLQRSRELIESIGARSPGEMSCS